MQILEMHQLEPPGGACGRPRHHVCRTPTWHVTWRIPQWVSCRMRVQLRMLRAFECVPTQRSLRLRGPPGPGCRTRFHSMISCCGAIGGACPPPPFAAATGGGLRDRRNPRRARRRRGARPGHAGSADFRRRTAGSSSDKLRQSRSSERATEASGVSTPIMPTDSSTDTT